jgi:aminoglycoside phosphotransferase (APT) family kinase protein
MHVDEAYTDASIVRRLLAGQFPQWADLPLKRVGSAGTDNAIYRLGEDMAVRLPRRPGAAKQVEKEQQWLPKLAPHLPLAVPLPLAKGSPAEGFPWNWSVCRWIEGENATVERIADQSRLALELAAFILALQKIDPANGPPAGEHNFFRGVPLAMRDASTREAIASLDGVIDIRAVTKIWDAALRIPVWNGPPVWIHGDLHPGNLLALGDRLNGVIDWGGLGVGDPACELIVAWNLLSGESRNLFRSTLSVDEATWARGRAWALSVALIALPYYSDTNPEIVGWSRRVIDEVLSDHRNAA